MEIVNIDNLSYGSNLANLKDLENSGNHTFVRLDITDTEGIHDLLRLLFGIRDTGQVDVAHLVAPALLVALLIAQIARGRTPPPGP
jgi:hypothetical protein